MFYFLYYSKHNDTQLHEHIDNRAPVKIMDIHILTEICFRNYSISLMFCPELGLFIAIETCVTFGVSRFITGPRKPPLLFKPRRRCWHRDHDLTLVPLLDLLIRRAVSRLHSSPPVPGLTSVLWFCIFLLMLHLAKLNLFCTTLQAKHSSTLL